MLTLHFADAARSSPHLRFLWQEARTAPLAAYVFLLHVVWAVAVLNRDARLRRQFAMEESRRLRQKSASIHQSDSDNDSQERWSIRSGESIDSVFSVAEPAGGADKKTR